MKLVLLPGMDGTGKLFSDLQDVFSSDATTVVISYPSNRKLSFYELSELVKMHFPINEEFVIIAESFSVPVAIICAAKNPANLKALVLCVGFATSPIKGLNRCIALVLAPVFLRMPLPKIVFKIWLLGGNVNSSLLSKIKTIISSVKKNVLVNRLKAVFRCDVREELGKIKIPILYIRAKNDRLISKTCYVEIKAVNLNTELAEINGPHLILQNEPIKSAKIILRFIKKCSVARLAQ